MRLSPFGVLAIALVCAGLSACAEEHEATLLEIDAVGPPRLDPGHRLVIEGGPFAAGHAVEVRFDGVLARPFAPSERFDETRVAQAVSEERVEVRASALAPERLGRATFRGRIEVREAARWDDERGTVIGVRDGVVLDFVPSRARTLEGEPLEDVLGVSWLEGDAGGLAIASVTPGGLGDSLGLAEGDVLVGEGDARLIPGDAPRVPDRTTALALAVVRDGGAPHVLHVPLGERAEIGATQERVWLVQLAVLLAWIALVLAWPASAVDYAAPRTPAALRRPTLALVARALGSLALGFGLLRLAASGALPPAGTVIAMIAGLRAALVLAGAQAPWRAAPLAILSGVGLAAGLAALPIALDAGDLAVLARDGSATPLAWALWCEPVGPVALALVVVSVAASRVERRWLAPFDDLLALAIAALVVVEGTGLSPFGRTAIVSSIVLVALLTWLLGHVRGRLRGGAAVVAIVALAVLGAVLATAWMSVDPPAVVRGAVAEAALVMTVVLALGVLRAAVSSRVPLRVQHALL